MTDLVIHGHFYQPPRENPWTGCVERDPQVKPFHDWNERICHECYRANAFARIFDSYGRVERIVNNFERISFDAGPTLLSWLEEHDKPTYDRIIDADRVSALRNGGHGNAIAHAFNHAILPLMSERDRVTQVRWGLADFRRRFGREPEAMWLPETACDHKTLGTLIDEGLLFAILSPYQAARVRDLSGGQWTNVDDGSIDAGVAYEYFHRDGSGRSIALFFYDGPLARAIAFEGLLVSSQTFVAGLAGGRGGDGRLVHVATDGESYGHHFRLGELTLAHALMVEGPNKDIRFTNYGAFLAAHTPTREVEIKDGPDGEGTSWSCAHGVGRWYRDCGCQTDGQDGWRQTWRTPLRAAFDLLRGYASERFEEQGSHFFAEPWKARDAYADLFLDPARPRDEWLRQHAKRPLDDDEKVRALTLLEMQKSALLMYTSCGWFFADLAGPEGKQVLSYAAHALDLMQELGLDPPRRAFLEILGNAKSNKPGAGSGADFFAKVVEPQRVTPARIASHLAISSLVEEGDESGVLGEYRFRRSHFQRQSQGKVRLAVSHVAIERTTTGRRHEHAVGSIHLGGIDFYCTVRDYAGQEQFAGATARVWAAFRTASLPTMLRVLQQELGPDEAGEEGGLESVLPEGRERISELVLGGIVESFADAYARMYEGHQRELEHFKNAGFELPKEVSATAELALGRRFDIEMQNASPSSDPADYAKAIEIADEAKRLGYEIDRSRASRVLGDIIADAVTLATTAPASESIRRATQLVELARRLRADAHLSRAQEILYRGLLELAIDPSALSGLAIGLGFAPSVVGRRESLMLELRPLVDPGPGSVRSP
jgi:alpha-amylase/alpha-mannosidase (GH57 family)